ncbi:MAG TPA: GNAT family N-acetyltransferase [Candidatus Krumholzibacteria bacterium]
MTSPRLELQTPRLTLVPVTLETITAEISDRKELGRLLNAEIPSGWPPPLNDAGTMQWTKQNLLRNPDTKGWGTWHFLLRRDSRPPVLIGNGGFKGKFVAPGTCEVGYSIMEEHQRRGYASEAVAAFVKWAFTHPEIDRVVAHTLTELTPSIRVLEKNGFTRVDETLEEGAIMFELRRR